MKTAIHIIVNCTERKRAPVPRALRLREVRARDVATRAEKWLERLHSNDAPTVPANNLYGGDHWAVAQRLPACAAAVGLTPYLWVASAGYGLVPADAALRPYSATFASGALDAVTEPGLRGARRDEQLTTWWTRLADARGPARGAPRSLAALAAGDRRAHLLVVGSADYLLAMEQDLIAARGELAAPELLLVISSGGKARHRDLGGHIVATDARLQARLRGARQSLGARIAESAIADAPRHGLVPDAVRRQFADIASACPELPSYDRSPMTDDSVRSYIRQHLRRDPSLTHTRLLRQLRADGRACEQSRFRDLFRSVRAAW